VSRPSCELDIECFSNWFLCGITAGESRWDFHLMANMPLDLAAIQALLQHFTIYTFNGNHYDLLMLTGALQGFDNAQLKALNDDIIKSGDFSWATAKRWGLRTPAWIDHVDVMEPTPGVRMSLKQYAGRVHAPEMVETPIDFDAPMSEYYIPKEVAYCQNDRVVTRMIREGIKDRLALREQLSTKYGIDLRSKSDAQIAEAVFKAECSALIQQSEGRYINEWVDPLDTFPHLAADYYRDSWGNVKFNIPHYTHGQTFKPKLPEYIEFATPYMQEFLQMVRDCDFFVSNKEEAELLGMDGKKIKTGVMIPDALKGRDIVIGQTVYRVGIGGLHSQESRMAHVSIPGECQLITADVDSYYPSLILNAGMYPKQLGPMFLEIYRTIFDQRMDAKSKVGQLKKMGLTKGEDFDVAKTIEGGFKIVLNGTFGKLFSRYSIFYAPELGIAVTIGGQLSLLMLIERLELSGIQVVSANTDGIEMKVPSDRMWIAQSIIDWWKATTNLGMSQETYWALYARDVNNYISVHYDGTTKRKGVFRESGLIENKHPDCDVCADAVVEFVTKGTPVMSTIMGCKDIRKFVRIRGVTGGGIYVASWSGARVLIMPKLNEQGKLVDERVDVHGGQYLGKTVRWYYSTKAGFIVDSKKFNQVAGSENAMPAMTLPDALPADIDYQKYIDIAESMLEDIGFGLQQ